MYLLTLAPGTDRPTAGDRQTCAACIDVASATPIRGIRAGLETIYRLGEFAESGCIVVTAYRVLMR